MQLTRLVSPQVKSLWDVTLFGAVDMRDFGQMQR